MTDAHHPYADIVPMTNQEKQASLQRDIRKHGQREPIVSFENRILDGRGRHRICLRLGIQPKIAEYVGDDALAYVLRQNRDRLNKSQRAVVVARAVLVFNRDPRPLLTMMGISESAARRGMRLLTDGTDRQVHDVLEGRGSVNIADHLRHDTQLPSISQRGKPGPKPKPKPPPIPPAQRRIAMRDAAMLWGHLRDAMEHLGCLPRPDHTVHHIRKMSPAVAKIIDQRLPGLATWLKEFLDEWHKSAPRDGQRTNGSADGNAGADTLGEHGARTKGGGDTHDAGAGAQPPQA